MKKTTLVALLLIAPGMGAFLLFNLYPIVYSIYLSFTDAQLGNFPLETTRELIVTGLENYAWIVNDPGFRGAFLWTWLFVVFSVIAKLIFGIALTLVYSSKWVVGKTLYRGLLMIPWALPLLFSVSVWRFMFDPIFGPANIILKTLGMTDLPAWTIEANPAFFVMIVIETWLAYPFMMTIITSALQSVSQGHIEASIIDGAGYFQRLFRIILPIAGKPIAFGAILTSAASFQFFMVPFIYNSALFEDRFLLLYGYRKGFASSIPHYGRAAAAMIVAMIFLAIFMYIAMRITKIQEGSR